MRTSIIVPVYNGAHVLPLTVPAVLAQAGVDAWVWVDDGSTDGTGRVLRALLDGEPRARVVRQPENRGRAAARNRGLAATSGDVVVFFDADVRPPLGAARRLADAVAGRGAVASVGRVRPVLDRPDDPYQTYLARHPRGASGAPGSAVSWKYWITCVCAARRSALDAAGRFDEAVEYGEDLALACRLRRRHPDGLRLADVAVDLFDVGTLASALANMRSVGRVLPALVRRCPDVLALAGVERAAASRALLALARVPVPERLLRAGLRVLPTAARPRAVRYLLGHALLSAFAGAPRRPPPSDPVGGPGGRLRRG